jgi:hypothetical protein
MINYGIPAYESYAYVCHPEKINMSNYVVLGQLNTTNDKITLTINEEIESDSDLYNEVYKHENCHLTQVIRGYPSRMCEDPIQKYFSEVECYIAEDLPDFIYYQIYYDIK